MAEQRFTLSARQRLKTPSQYQLVYKSKQWGGSPHFSFNVLAINAAQPMLGVTVSKKVSKSAVDRNRLKRQIREFYRLHQHQLSGAQLVITAKPSSMKVSDQDRLESLKELWKKIMGWQRWQRKQKQLKLETES